MPLVFRRVALAFVCAAASLVAATGSAAARGRWDDCATVRLAPDAYAVRLHNTLETARSLTALKQYQVQVRLAPSTELVNRCEFAGGGTLKVWLLLVKKGAAPPNAVPSVGRLGSPMASSTAVPGPQFVGQAGAPDAYVASYAEYKVSDETELPSRVGVGINFYDAFRHVRTGQPSSPPTADLDPLGMPLSSAEGDVPYELDAWVRLEWAPRKGGAGVVWARTGVPVSIDVKDVPALEFSLVNHPGAVAITRLQCQDLVGTIAGTTDDPNAGVSSDYCEANPFNPVWMDSVYTAPLGLRLRAVPIPDWSAFGVSTELSTIALGESGWFSSTVSDDAEPALGVVTPIAWHAGIDLRADVGGTELTFQGTGGFMLVHGVADIAVRPTIGFNVSVPITSVNLARSGEKESQ